MGPRNIESDLSIATEETYSDGEIIFQEGSSGDWIYLLLSGRVEIYKVIGGKKVVVDVLEPGDIFGELSFIDKHPRSASAKAVGDVQVGVYDMEYLVQEYNKLPSDFRRVFDYIARRLRKMTNVAANLAGRKTERIEQNIEVHYQTADEFFKAYSKNIGGGGLFIKTNDLLRTGTEVRLKFTLPGDELPFNTLGKVIWLKEDEEKGMGIQFINFSAQDQIRLNAFLRQGIKS
ncbi:MAG: TIGR02266 family protein [Deltaproteobacteria bacterium]|nr:TIGR02266 family protein [Deltaproteobacteria bacterium]